MIRSQYLRDFDQVVRIEHRCWSLCCFERFRSVRTFRDRLSGGWASGNWGRTSVRGYTRSQLFRPRSASLGDTPKYQAKDGQYYADILKEMKAKVEPWKAGLEGVTFQSAARSEHVEVARCFRCLGCGHGCLGCCNPDRKNSCLRCGATGHLAQSCKATPRCLTCIDRGDKDIAHVSGCGSCPVIREELRRLRGRNWSSCNSTSEGGRMPRASWCRLPGRGGPMYCSLVSSTNGLRTLLGFKMHQRGPASLFVPLI